MMRPHKVRPLATLAAAAALGIVLAPGNLARAQAPTPRPTDAPKPAETARPAEPAKPAEAAPPADAPKAGDKPAEAAPPADAPKAGDKPAEAAPPEKPKATGIDEARRRMEAGQSFFAKGEYAKAMTEFEAAYEAMPQSAFLFNAAFAAEKAGDRQRAIAQYEKYLASDPKSAEAPQIKETIARLQRELSAPAVSATAEGGEGASEAARTTEAKPADEQSLNEMRSLVLVESDPAGAPIEIYERVVPTAPEFKSGKETPPGWRKVVSGAQTPKYVSLKVGHYHVVVDAFQDFKRSETDINLTPGQVYIFRANLSQGEFLGFLRVTSNVEGAKIHLDDPMRKSAPWARTPQGGPVNDGKHDILVTAPGFKPAEKKGISVRHGQQETVDVNLERVDHGYLVLDGNIDIPEVEIDGKEEAEFRLDSRSPYKLKLPAGKHAIVLDASGRKELETTIDIPRGQELPISAVLNPSYPRAKAVWLGILAGGAGAAGTWLHLKHEDRQSVPDRNTDLDPVFDYGRYAGWGLGGLFLGLSVFYAIYDPLPDSTLKIQRPREFPEDDSPVAPSAKPAPVKSARGFVVPIVGSNGGGFGVVGTF